MRKINKTGLIVLAVIMFGMGGLVDRMLSKRNYDALRVTMILEFEAFIWDLEDDVNKNRMDSTVASYYLHNFRVIYEDLTYTPEQYIGWYE